MNTFVITRMYAGAYLDDSLGGEAINLLHDDHNNNYVFVGKLGFIDSRYDNTVKGVILTRLTKAGCFEILGIAKIGKNGQIAYKNDKNIAKTTSNYCLANDIRYSGIPFRSIYPENPFGADISFKSEELLLPKEEIYITDSHNKDYKIDGVKVINLSDKRFPNQSLHSYITDVDNPEAYDSIVRLMEDEYIWDKGRMNKVEEGKIIDKHFCFLDVIHKGYDELSYSNLFSYIFKKYPKAFIQFAREVLGVNICSNYKINREKANIDLWVEDSNNILVIENKIKSGINGITARHNFSEKGLIQSQLLKYYKYAEKEKADKQTHYYIFVPNYNKIDLKKYSGSKHYQEIKYSDIYNFFSKIDINDAYFVEFVNALYKHTKDREIDYAEDMAIKFLDKIRTQNLR